MWYWSYPVVRERGVAAVLVLLTPTICRRVHKNPSPPYSSYLSTFVILRLGDLPLNLE